MNTARRLSDLRELARRYTRIARLVEAGLTWNEAVVAEAQNVPFSRQTADRYRHVYAESGHAKLRNVSSLTDAYRAIGVLSAPAEPE